MLRVYILLLAFTAVALSERVDYTGHKVLRVTPKSKEHSEFLHKLRDEYNIDLWNEPHVSDIPVLFRLRPDIIKTVEDSLTKYGMEYDVAHYDLQSAIEAERAMIAPRKNASEALSLDFRNYHSLSDIYLIFRALADQSSGIATLETIGKSYEGRNIINLKIGGNPSKPAIMMECGIHAREWVSVSTCVYLVNKLLTDPDVKSLVDKYEFNVIPVANPDGYTYTFSDDRMWRKTRSLSMTGGTFCRGVDANRNFDIQHCGVGTSSNPCSDIYCGPHPFSENEAAVLRDMMLKLQSRFKAYISIHAFSQLWMTPYGITKQLPPNYSELQRVGQAGVTDLAKKYGTRYRVGSIANIIYEAAGSSADYAYDKVGVKMSFALELRDEGQYGFMLPTSQILPTCEETYDGLVSAIQAMQ